MYPKQRVSFKEKNKDEWKKAMVDYLRGRAVPAVSDLHEYYQLYALANGEIEEEDYTYVTNPLDIKAKGKGYPAKMRNMDIISPSYQLILAEKRERPILRYAVPLNSGGISSTEEKMFGVYKEALKQFYINALVEAGAAPEELQQAPPSPDEIKKKSSSIAKEKALEGEAALDYFDFYNELPRRFVDGFADYTICGQVFSYKDINYEELHYEIVPAREISYFKSDTLTFLEDAECVIRTQSMSINDVLERFEGEDGFDKDVITFLEAKISGNPSGVEGNSFLKMAASILINSSMQVTQGEYENSDSVQVEHITFKSWAKIYEVEQEDVFGNIVTERYDETYKPDEFENVKETWVRQFFEIYLIDEKFYVGLKPIPFTRSSMSNPNVCKGLYNGRIFSTRFNKPNSWIKKGKSYQFKHNLIYYHLEKTLAKNKDKIIILPLDLIPDKEGYDETTLMYFADAHGYMFVDTQGDAKKIQSLQYVKSIDAGLTQYIGSLYELLNANKAQWDEVAGMNQQRKGNITGRDGKGVTQEAIYRGSLMSENMFAEFDEFQAREYQGLMDFAKYCWINGKKAQFRTSDGRTVMLNLDPEKFANEEYNVFIDSSKEAQRVKELVEGIAFARAQNSERSSEAIKIVTEKNPHVLMQYLEELDYELDQRQQAAAQAENENAKMAMEQKERHHYDELELKYYEIDEKNETTIEGKMIDSGTKLAGQDLNENGIDDGAEIIKSAVKREEIQSKERIAREKTREEKQLQNRKLDIEEKRIAADKFIAKVNKN